MSEWLKPDVVIQVLAIIFAAFAAYFAIKGDLKVMHSRMEAHEKRLDAVEGDIKHFAFSDRRHPVSNE